MVFVALAKWSACSLIREQILESEANASRYVLSFLPKSIVSESTLNKHMA
jgi:hypothetical protein